ALHLELLEVQSPPQRAGAHTRQPFSLLFALRSGSSTLQSTLYLRHDGFEPCAWFVNRVVVPEGNPGVPYYEAVFACPSIMTPDRSHARRRTDRLWIPSSVKFACSGEPSLRSDGPTATDS